MIPLPDSVRTAFEEEGWAPDRCVPVSESVPTGHPAASILATFGGLKVGPLGSKPERPLFQLEFIGADWNGSNPPVIRTWSGLLDTQLVLLAGIQAWHAALYIDDSGRCFGHSDIIDVLWFLGDSFTEAVERHLQHREGRPMLRPDQTSIRWYMETVTRNDPRVYRY